MANRGPTALGVAGQCTGKKSRRWPAIKRQRVEHIPHSNTQQRAAEKYPGAAGKDAVQRTTHSLQDGVCCIHARRPRHGDEHSALLFHAASYEHARTTAALDDEGTTRTAPEPASETEDTTGRSVSNVTKDAARPGRAQRAKTNAGKNAKQTESALRRTAMLLDSDLSSRFYNVGAQCGARESNGRARQSTPDRRS